MGPLGMFGFMRNRPEENIPPKHQLILDRLFASQIGTMVEPPRRPVVTMSNVSAQSCGGHGINLPYGALINGGKFYVRGVGGDGIRIRSMSEDAYRDILNFSREFEIDLNILMDALDALAALDLSVGSFLIEEVFSTEMFAKLQSCDSPSEMVEYLFSLAVHASAMSRMVF